MSHPDDRAEPTYDDLPYEPYDGGADHLDHLGGDAVEVVDDPSAEAPSRTRRRKKPVETEDLLDRLHDVVSGARSLPLSASVSINRDEVLDLIEEAKARLPDELRNARWLRKEREEYLAKVEADGEALLAEARTQVERMVQRTEVVKAAEHRARRILDGAEAEARRLRLECEDFCDQKLAGFEIVLERTLNMVSQGRSKLQATNLPPEPGERAQLPDR